MCVAGLRASDFGAAVIAARVHAGGYPRQVMDFVRANRAALEVIPNAFVSVSMSAAKLVPGDEGRIAKYIGDFIGRGGWTPNCVYHVAGARYYTRHNAVGRWMLGLVDGHRYETDRDHEWTDWVALAKSADECLAAFTRIGVNRFGTAPSTVDQINVSVEHHAE